jgi:outer membrane lipoprotein SlyB
MFCEPADEDPVVDAFEALAVAEPTTTVTTTSTATATAVRPVVVQTDFAEDGAAALPLLGVGALVTIAAGAVGLARGRVRTAARRH